MIFGSIRIAFTSLRAHKITSVLAVLLLSIGVALLVAWLSINSGIKQTRNELQNHYSQDTFFVTPARPDIQATDLAYPSVLNLASSMNLNPLTPRDLSVLRDNSDVDMSAAYTILNGDVQIDSDRSGETIRHTSIISVSPDFMDLMALKLQSGQKFDSVDNTRVVIVGKVLAGSMFGDGGAIGQTLTINRQDFTVVGILQDNSKTPTSLDNNMLAASLVIPIDNLERLTNRKQAFDGLIYRLQSNVDSEKVNHKISSQLSKTNRSNRGNNSFEIQNINQIMQTSSASSQLLKNITFGLIILVLLTAGLGLLVFMKVSVVARSREFAIRKTVGASNLQIMTQLTTEAFFVGLFSTILGVILSIGVTQLVNDIGVTLSYSLENLLITLMFSILTSVLFSLPAIFATARKNVVYSE